MSSSVTIAALSGLGAGGFLLLYQCLNFSSYWWQQQTRKLVEICRSHSLQVEPMGKQAHGTLSGLDFKLVFSKAGGGKSKTPLLKATLVLAGAPAELKLENEDLLTGVFRAFGNSDTELGDRDFDSAFWVEGQDSDALRAYFTPARKRALLRHLPFLPEARLILGVLESSYRPLFPFQVAAKGRDMMEHLAGIAAAFSGESDTMTEPAPGGILRHKVRRVAAVSAWLFLFFAAACFVTPDGLGRQAGLTISGLGLAACFAAYLAGELGRAVLQSFFAFLSILQLAAVGVYFTGAFGAVRVSDGASVLLSAFVGISLCWGARHHLKRLSRFAEVR